MQKAGQGFCASSTQGRVERKQRRWGGGLSGTEGGGWAGAGRGPVPGVFFISKNVLGAKVAQCLRGLILT